LRNQLKFVTLPWSGLEENAASRSIAKWKRRGDGIQCKTRFAYGAGVRHALGGSRHGLHLPGDALHLWSSQIDMRWVLLGLGLTLIVGDIAWRPAHTARPGTKEAPDFEGILALPDKPSIAVLPLHNLSDDPAQEYFSDGITEDIITELSRFRALFVIARNSTFTYKGKPTDVREVGREPNACFIRCKTPEPSRAIAHPDRPGALSDNARSNATWPCLGPGLNPQPTRRWSAPPFLTSYVRTTPDNNSYAAATPARTRCFPAVAAARSCAPSPAAGNR
jgi:hypothetical protein